MKNAVIILFIFLSFISKAQSPIQIKYGLMQSRDYKFKIANRIDSSKYVSTAFDANKGLYPISLKENSNGANTVYYRENGITNFFVFQGTIPSNIKYSDLDKFTKTIKASKTVSKSALVEKKDILFSCKAESIEVIPKGTYQLQKSILLGVGVTFFEATNKCYITDPTMFEYFDFPSEGVTPEKLCYNWQGADKVARLYHQGKTKINVIGSTFDNRVVTKDIYPSIESFSADDSKIILKNDNNSQRNLRASKVVLDLNAMFSSNNKPALDTFYDVNYKVRNDNTIYAIRVQFSSCENASMERKKTNLDTIILPTNPDGTSANTCQSVPGGTTVGLNPQP